MHVIQWIIIGVLALAIVVAIVVHFGWSISTQHRDHGAVSSGPPTRRRIWARHKPAAHAGPVNPEAIPEPRSGQSATGGSSPRT